MSKYDQVKIANEFAFSSTQRVVDHRNDIANELSRVSDISYNAGMIISDLDKQFAEATKLNGTDVAFLFFASALQCARWIIIPSFDLDFSKPSKDQRLTSQQGGEIEKKLCENI